MVFNAVFTSAKPSSMPFYFYFTRIQYIFRHYVMALFLMFFRHFEKLHCMSLYIYKGVPESRHTLFYSASKNVRRHLFTYTRLTCIC